ncbi:MAG: radical SAM protein [Phycisphaerae bacterium]|nr:radical SAM protein [Phycisphaerae bacterium]
MPLPIRDSGDQLLPPGELVDIRRRLRAVADRHDLATVIACAFDHRTRMLPFIFADTRMAPAGPRAIGSALIDSGFAKTRIVLQQWNRNFQPSRMQLDGRMPDIFGVSSMSLHTAPARAMIRDICRIDPARRPLVIAGGSMCVYEPWEAFYTTEGEWGTATRKAAPSSEKGDSPHADVAVTGEEYVLLNLLEVLLAERGSGEPIRQTFLRIRDRGGLDGVPGLVYPRTDAAGRVIELVDTGIQRLVGDLDELPFADAGYAILEAPGKGATLASQPLAANLVRKASPIGSLTITFGCKFSCEYCPIPVYNQRHIRSKSGDRLAEELVRLVKAYKIRYYFGTDDNFLNNQPRALAILEKIAATDQGGIRLRNKVRWGTEATVHDTLAMRDHMDLMVRAGLRALWLGVEDMSGALVRKGQGHDRTVEAFKLMADHGIAPMAMMMHHDAQPLLSTRDDSGLLNQINLLRKAGAVSVQVLMITPSAGSKLFDGMYTSGQVFTEVAGKGVEPRMYDGNHVIASGLSEPWRKQLNIQIAYLFFYNPLRFFAGFFKLGSKLKKKPVGMQALGMVGLVHTIRRTIGWAGRLIFGRIKRAKDVPAGPFPMRSPTGGVAAHARGERADITSGQ